MANFVKQAKPSRPNSRYIRQLVSRLASQQNFRCYWCDQDEPLTFDHIVPHSQGGPTTIDNGVAACEPCNRDRADMPFEIYAAKVGK